MNSTDLAPSVQMAWDGRVVQWTPDEAIRHAFNMLEVRGGGGSGRLYSFPEASER